jgi:hypothetical protein
MDWLPPIYILCNPEKESVRYNFLLSHLPKKGIPIDKEKVKWVKGIWGSEITPELYFKLYDPFIPRLNLKQALCFKSAALLKGEISLTLNFLIAIQNAVKDDSVDFQLGENNKFSKSEAFGKSSWILIFESDVYLRDDFLERLKTILESEDAQKADYISLGEGVGTRPPSSIGTSYFSETKLYKPPHNFPFRCTDSMLLKKSFLEKLILTLIPFRECLDWELNVQLLAHKGVALWADPPLVEPGSGRGRVKTLLPS